jgi:hypothetical protein
MLRKPHCVGRKNSLPGGELDMQRLLLSFLLLFFMSSPLLAAFDNTHRPWNDLLKQHVQWNPAGTASAVDYAGFSKDRVKLNAYLKSLSTVSKQEYSLWPLAEQQAFLINAYNAYTVELILTRYPKLESIKDLGSLFSSPWKQRFFSLLGEKRSLDDVEHSLLRGDKRYQDPRIHFAVNCASIGCPALRDEAFTSAKLAVQLEDQSVRFLSDQTRNRFDSKTSLYSISKIFDWYGDDFLKHSGGVKTFIARRADKLRLPASATAKVKQAQFEIEYANYDWSLNKAK